MSTKNFTILIVEDDFSSRETLKLHLQNLGFFKLLEAKNSREAILHCESENILLTFLDIGLVDSELDGIELGKKLNLMTETAIIFTSAYSDKTTLDRSEGVDHQEYLSKPIRERDVHVAMQRALKEKLKPKVLVRTSSHQCVFQNQDENVYIKGNDKFYKKIHIQDIVYIKAEKGGVNVETLESGTLFTYTTLTSFLRQYPHPGILKIHNGHAINKKHIMAKSENLIRMVDGTELAIGLKWREKMDEHFQIVKPKS